MKYACVYLQVEAVSDSPLLVKVQNNLETLEQNVIQYNIVGTWIGLAV